jgi:hypothetical protein
VSISYSTYPKLKMSLRICPCEVSAMECQSEFYVIDSNSNLPPCFQCQIRANGLPPNSLLILRSGNVILTDFYTRAGFQASHSALAQKSQILHGGLQNVATDIFAEYHVLAANPPCNPVLMDPAGVLCSPRAG